MLLLSRTDPLFPRPACPQTGSRSRQSSSRGRRSIGPRGSGPGACRGSTRMLSSRFHIERVSRQPVQSVVLPPVTAQLCWRRGGARVAVHTRPVRFSGSRLFINVDCPEGELRVEVVDGQSNAFRPFTASPCRPIVGRRHKGRSGPERRRGPVCHGRQARVVQVPAAPRQSLLVPGKRQGRWPQ